MHMHFTLGAYFELHFRQCNYGSILYGPCEDSESYVRGGPTQHFLVDKGGEDPNTTKSGGHYSPASETSF